VPLHAEHRRVPGSRELDVANFGEDVVDEFRAGHINTIWNLIEAGIKRTFLLLSHVRSI